MDGWLKNFACLAQVIILANGVVSAAESSNKHVTITTQPTFEDRKDFTYLLIGDTKNHYELG